MKAINPSLTTAATSFARAMNAKTVKRVKPAARTNVINLTKNNNNNKSLDQLVKNNRAYRQQISNTTERLRAFRPPAKYPITVARLRKKLLGLQILKAEGAATHHKKTGDTNREKKARTVVASLKRVLKRVASVAGRPV